MTNQTNQLPTLTGSETQILLATKIRADKMPALVAEKNRVEDLLVRIEKREFVKPVTDEQIERHTNHLKTGLKVIEILMNRTAAGFWIDNKDASVHKMMHVMMPAPPK